MNKDEPIHIIGAGEFGLTTALALHSRGYTYITLYDRFEPPVPDGSSYGINRAVRQDYGNDNLLQELATKSIQRWKQWSRDSVEIQGKPHYHETGVFLASASNDPNCYELTSFKNISKSGGGEHLIRSGKIQLDLYPGLKHMRTQLPGGYYNSVGGWVNATASIAYLVHKVKTLGIPIKHGKSGTFVELLRNTKNQVVGLRLQDGSSYKGTVVLCTGAWTPHVLREAREVMKAVGQPIIEMKLPPNIKKEFNKCPVWMADISKTGFYGFPPNEHGVIKIGHHGSGYVNFEDGVSVPTSLPNIPLEFVQKFRDFLREYFPVLADVDISSVAICWYCDSWDGDFYISRVPNQNNLFLAAGGSGHAFKFAPTLGDIVADVLEGKVTPETSRFKWRNQSQVKTEAARNSEATESDLKSVTLASAHDLRASRGKL